MKCRHCGNESFFLMADLKTSPPSNSYLKEEELLAPELYFPLKVLVCDHCFLAQTQDFSKAEDLFNSDYAYFSSFSSTWLEHARKFVSDSISRFKLHDKSFVVEVAANDGYLLQYFQETGIPNLGIEPTASTAKAARSKGIQIWEKFFGVETAEEIVAKFGKADLTVANNVLAHVPDINDFVKGFSILLSDTGVSSFEFPHLLEQIKESQFDTIYHEHYSYLSLTAVERIFQANGLQVFDVEKVKTHGGSLRVFAQKLNIGKHKIENSVNAVKKEELDGGLFSKDRFMGFQEKIESIKLDFLSFLIEAKKSGKSVAAYGAAAKGNTLLNFSGVKSDLIDFVMDKNPSKQNKYLPGSRIPILGLEVLEERKRPDYLVIFPWNLFQEIQKEVSIWVKNGTKLVTAIPELKVHA